MVSDQKLCFKTFGKVKFIKVPVGFKLMSYRFAANTLTHCAVRVRSQFWKEKYYKIILYFLIHFDIYVKILRSSNIVHLGINLSLSSSPENMYNTLTVIHIKYILPIHIYYMREFYLIVYFFWSS